MILWMNRKNIQTVNKWWEKICKLKKFCIVSPFQFNVDHWLMLSECEQSTVFNKLNAKKNVHKKWSQFGEIKLSWLWVVQIWFKEVKISLFKSILISWNTSQTFQYHCRRGLRSILRFFASSNQKCIHTKCNLFEHINCEIAIIRWNAF